MWVWFFNQPPAIPRVDALWSTLPVSDPCSLYLSRCHFCSFTQFTPVTLHSILANVAAHVLNMASFWALVMFTSLTHVHLLVHTLTAHLASSKFTAGHWAQHFHETVLFSELRLGGQPDTANSDLFFSSCLFPFSVRPDATKRKKELC